MTTHELKLGVIGYLVFRSETVWNQCATFLRTLNLAAKAIPHYPREGQFLPRPPATATTSLLGVLEFVPLAKAKPMKATHPSPEV